MAEPKETRGAEHLEKMLARIVTEIAGDLVHVDKPYRAQALARVLALSFERASNGATPRETLEIVYNAIGDGIMECVMVLDQLAEAEPAGRA